MNADGSSHTQYLVKRSHGQPFSKDPLNLTNKNSRKYSGLVNPKAIGIQPAEHGVLSESILPVPNLNDLDSS